MLVRSLDPRKQMRAERSEKTKNEEKDPIVRNGVGREGETEREDDEFSPAVDLAPEMSRPSRIVSYSDASRVSPKIACKRGLWLIMTSSTGWAGREKGCELGLVSGDWCLRKDEMKNSPLSSHDSCCAKP
jgi:hypothetical protein